MDNEDEDGDEKMVALDETSCLMMLDIQRGSGLETSAQNTVAHRGPS